MKTFDLRQWGHLLAQAAGLVLVIILVCGVSRGQTPWSTPDPSNNINNTNSGNVGIGTSTPATKLDVAGTIQTQNLNLNSGNYSGSLNWGNNSYANWYMAGSGSGSSIRFKTWDGSSYSDKVTFQNDGSVGIGTTTPSFQLDVRNGIMGVTSSAGNTAAWLRSLGSGGRGTLELYDSGTRKTAFYSDGNDSYINGGGNFGIGTASPGGKLEVKGSFSFFSTSDWNGSSAGGALTVYPFTNYTALYHLKNGGTEWGNVVLVHGGGNVGIGTTSPGKPLTVQASIGANAIAINGRSDDYGYLEFFRNNGTTLSGAVYSKTDRVTITDASATDVLTVKAGSVGINTNTPTSGYKLDVNGDARVGGNINLTGTINAKYQDVAEWVESSEQLAAGTVVILDSTKPNQVISSTQSYDTRVAGVISAQPGIALGEKGEGKVLVATTGRVKIKVDASKSPIQIGDLLVTSDIPGVAMKSEAVNLGGVQFHRPGTLIGKALEPLAKGLGEILVLLSLQ